MNAERLQSKTTKEESLWGIGLTLRKKQVWEGTYKRLEGGLEGTYNKRLEAG